jgi:hypothetical protein
MADDRATWEGSPEELMPALAEGFKVSGISVCTYNCEVDKVAQAKLLHGPRGVEGNHALKP